MTSDATASDATTSDAMTSDGGDQGRNVRQCEVRIVCEDGSVNEASQPLCLTAEETSAQLAFAQEGCIEDMTAACEDIGSGASLECSAECSEALEPCNCDDPTQGCEI